MESLETNRQFLKSDQWNEWKRQPTDQKEGVPVPPPQKAYPDDAALIDLPGPEEFTVGEMSLLEAIKRRTPMERIGKMKDLTGPAIFLASSESDFMCGQSLIIDGGWMAYGFLQM